MYELDVGVDDNASNLSNRSKARLSAEALRIVKAWLDISTRRTRIFYEVKEKQVVWSQFCIAVFEKFVSLPDSLHTQV